MSLKHLTAFCLLGATAVTGAVGGTRWRNVEVKRAELNTQYENILEETRAMNEDLLKHKEELAKKINKNAALHEAIDTMWTDRMQRYKETNDDLHAYVKALPEALGVIKGLNNHYQYMAEHMREFIGFDVACTKVHNLALLIDHGRAVGFGRVSDTLRQLYLSEPIIEGVCENLDSFADVSAPRTVGEASETFCYCMNDLQRAVAASTAALEESLVAPSAPSTPSVLTDVIRKGLRSARLDLLSREQRELEEKKSKLDALLVQERSQLHTLTDVRAALEYATNVVEKLHQPSGGGSAADASYARFIKALREDAEVVRCLQQIELWRNSAAAFLMTKQAETALHSYQVLLSETLTHVDSSKK